MCRFYVHAFRCPAAWKGQALVTYKLALLPLYRTCTAQVESSDTTGGRFSGERRGRGDRGGRGGRGGSGRGGSGRGGRGGSSGGGYGGDRGGYDRPMGHGGRGGSTNIDVEDTSAFPTLGK
jgi:hypothetical protein